MKILKKEIRGTAQGIEPGMEIISHKQEKGKIIYEIKDDDNSTRWVRTLYLYNNVVPGFWKKATASHDKEIQKGYPSQSNTRV